MHLLYSVIWQCLVSFIQQLESKRSAWHAYFSQPLPETPQQPHHARHQNQQQQNQQLSPLNTAAPQYNSYGNRAYRPQQAQHAQQPLRQWHEPSQQRQGYQQYPSQPSQRRIEAPSGSVDVPVPAYIVANLACGLIIGLAQLEAMDAHLYLKRKGMEINGTDIKLSYTNSAGSDSIGSMHLMVSTPTCIVHEERITKWAALARPAVQFKSNQSALGCTMSLNRASSSSIQTDQLGARKVNCAAPAAPPASISTISTCVQGSHITNAENVCVCQTRKGFRSSLNMILNVYTLGYSPLQ